MTKTRYWLKSEYTGRFDPAPWHIVFRERALAVVAVLFWFTVGLTTHDAFPWSGLIHEIGHWIFSWAQGVPAHITGWTSCSARYLTPVTLFAGYFVESLFIIALWAFVYTRRVPLLPAFLIGSFLSQTSGPFHSVDYDMLRRRWGHLYPTLLRLHYILVGIAVIAAAAYVIHKRRPRHMA